jgi:hypothetical protein
MNIEETLAKNILNKSKIYETPCPVTRPCSSCDALEREVQGMEKSGQKSRLRPLT